MNPGATAARTTAAVAGAGRAGPPTFGHPHAEREMNGLIWRRLRGVAGTMLTWSVGGGLAGAVAGAGLWAAVLLPRDYHVPLRDLLFGMGLAGALAGAVSGFGFAVVLAVAERRRTFEELRAWRVGACGAAAALAMGWLVSRDPGFAVACGTFGFGAAASSLAVARRALVAAPAAMRLPRTD